MPFVNHAIVHPPVDRNMAPGAPGGPTDIYAHVTRETDAGIYVTGAKVVATGSALTHFTFVAHVGLMPVQDKNFALVFLVPTNAPRASNSSAAYRTSSAPPCSAARSTTRCRAGSTKTTRSSSWTMSSSPGRTSSSTATSTRPTTSFRAAVLCRAFQLHGCTRLAVKLDFITGLLIKATETAGTRGFRGVEANIGEVITWRNAMWALSDAMAQKPRAVDRRALCCRTLRRAPPIRSLAPEAYVQVKHLIEKTVASSLIYLNSHARDFKAPELRKYLDRYVRGSGGVSAVERVKLMKLLWDAIGTEFGARHELYEINYAGSHEEIRRFALFGALASGPGRTVEGVRRHLHGRIRPRRLDGARPVNPDDVSAFGRKAP